MGVNPLRSMMSNTLEPSGLSVNSNHSLRATFASRMFASGVPEKIVAEFTGYKSIKSLRQYEKTTDSQLQAVGNSIARMEEYTVLVLIRGLPPRREKM